MKYELNEDQLFLPAQAALNNLTLKQLLDKFKVSKKLQHIYRQEKRILVNDQITSYQDTVLTNKSVTILLPKQEIDWALSSKEACVVYESKFVLIVHKPKGIIIHSHKQDVNCLNAMVARYYFNHHQHIYIRPIHRLDRDTCGLVFYAKIPFFQAYFDEAIKQKEIIRTYYAICLGPKPKVACFTINDPIAKDRHQQGLYRISKHGKQAKTICKYVSQYKNYSLFECQLLSGRTHQIRVHLKAHNYPIINDLNYGVYRSNLSQMGLFAIKIKFKNPITHKSHTIYDKIILEKILLEDY